MSLPISVVIPLYNREDTIGRALRSVRSQRPRPPDEIIVVDDGSSDHGAEIAASQGARVITHGSNRGLSAARNTGLAAARHDWVAFLDSDDEWLPDHLARLWSLRANHVLVGASSIRTGNGPSRGRLMGPVTSRRAVLMAPRDVLYPANPLAPSAAMLRRDAALALGGFRPWDGVIEDLDLWVRLLAEHTGVVAPEVGIRYHIHEQQMSGDHGVMQRAVRRALDSYVENGWCSSRTRALREGVLAWDALRARTDGSALVAAVRTLMRPTPALGALGALGARFLNRRESARWAEDGRPTVALLPGGPRDGRAPMPRALAPVDLSSKSVLAALGRLARRPTNFATIPNAAWHLPLRLLRIEPVPGPDRSTLP